MREDIKVSKGDKFIIEIDHVEKYVRDGEEQELYFVKGFKTCTFDKYGISLLQRYQDVKKKDVEYMPGDEVMNLENRRRYIILRRDPDVADGYLCISRNSLSVTEGVDSVVTRFISSIDRALLLKTGNKYESIVKLLKEIADKEREERVEYDV